MILLIGGSGLLGKELRKLDPNMLYPSRNLVDITNKEYLQDYVSLYKPDIVINTAAETDNRKIEASPESAISTNIIGAANIASVCLKYDIRLCYLSTDYVYYGESGNFKETDPLLPYNLYSWMKLGGECSTKAVKNHLIIRTSFGKSNFDYPKAFSDKYTSKDYVDIIAPMIYEAAISDLTGVLNIGTDRKSLFSYAKERNKDVEPILIRDSGFDTPWDTSLDLTKWNNYKNGKTNM